MLILLIKIFDKTLPQLMETKQKKNRRYNNKKFPATTNQTKRDKLCKKFILTYNNFNKVSVVSIIHKNIWCF